MKTTGRDLFHGRYLLMLIRKTVVQGLLLSARRYNSFISAVHGDFFHPRPIAW